MEIKTNRDLVAAIATGAHAFPGGYPVYFITIESECLCPECVKKNAAQHHRAIREKAKGLFFFKSDLLAGADLHFEGAPLICAECNREIVSAYGEPETDEQAA